MALSFDVDALIQETVAAYRAALQYSEATQRNRTIKKQTLDSLRKSLIELERMKDQASVGQMCSVAMQTDPT